MPTEHDGFVRALTAAQLRNDVAALRVRKLTCTHLEGDDDLLSAIGHAVKHLGVFDAQCGRRNRGDLPPVSR